jgi:hypothetical protein
MAESIWLMICSVSAATHAPAHASAHLDCISLAVAARLVASVVLHDAIEQVAPVGHLHDEVPKVSGGLNMR